MKFAIHLPDPSAKVDARAIPGGEKNVNGETYAEHFNAGGIIAFAVDFREASLPLKTYAAFHVLHNGAYGISATKHNRMKHRSYTLAGAITDMPFIKRPFISDVFITSMLTKIWSLSGGKVSVNLRTKPGMASEPCFTMSPDYATLVTSMRSWPTLVDVNKESVDSALASLRKEMMYSSQAGYNGTGLHKRIIKDMFAATTKVAAAITLRSTGNGQADSVG